MPVDRRAIPVTVEAVDTKVFASALDWPGWSRGGRTEPLALEALLAQAVRYAPVARRAGLDFPDDLTLR